MLEHITSSLLDKPLPAKHSDLKLLIFAGIYSIRALNRPDHASVNAVVNTTAALNKKWAKGLVNAILRSYIRKKSELDDTANANIEVQCNHPKWLATRIKNAWPDAANNIFKANNEQPPMMLRVNIAKTSRDEYLVLLSENDIDAAPGALVDSSILLRKPRPVDQLPGFSSGLVSVQDEASQLAGHILTTKINDSVLDACAAPGGKTCHLLEINPGIELIANDKDPARLKSVKENIERLNLSCQLTSDDLLAIHDKSFEKILLDVPCSATGIIRRHPDIKLLRRNSDIDKLCAMQIQLLSAAWQLLKHGGELLYSTCSILPEENENILSRFLSMHKEAGDVEIIPIQLASGIHGQHGVQLLPGIQGHDGFYYAHLRKISSSG
jgi:16S rRNA (cytosine967-C5)-methyltransferase